MAQIDDAPWFVAADIAKALGLTSTAQVKAISNMPSTHVRDYRVPNTTGRLNKIVSEAGVYALIMQSRKPRRNTCPTFLTA